MKTRCMWLLTIINLLLVTAGGVSAQDSIGPQAALSTTFTYQGRLTDSGSLANGTYDFQFSLYPTPGGSTAVAGPIPKNDVAVANGLFTVELDFGDVFDGSIRYLQIDVRAGASTGGFTSLSPRQPLRATPYAIYSSNSGSTEALQTHPVSAGPPLSGQVLKWDGTQWAPAADSNSGGDITGVNPGTGLSGGGSTGDVTLSANTAYLQRRVSGNCSAGNSIRAINSDGTVTCQTDNNTTYTNGPGLLLSGNQFSVSFGTTANTVARGNHDHFGQSWSGSSSIGLSVTNTSSSGIGINGDGFIGVRGLSSNNIAVYGNGFVGLRGDSSNNVGIYGSSSNLAIWGESGNIAVEGLSSGSGGATGVWGRNTGGGWAGYFSGNVYVNGNLGKAAGSFKIDHPLDPANKYLYHSFVESPDMMNIYNGIATLDANGEATVDLPDYFQALNQDFRYQLTCIGGFAQVYIAKEIQNNSFTIAGGKPGLKVSWQVTGIRHDAYANAHRIPVEEDKPPQERGKYLHPKEFGQPESKGIEFARQQAMQPGKTPSNPQGDAP